MRLSTGAPRLTLTSRLKRGAVDSLHCGHPREEDLVSVIARVRNSGVRAKTNRFLYKFMKEYVKVPGAM